MPTITLTEIPANITAGDSIAWTKTFSDFPASDGWTLSYALTKSDNQIVFESTPDGNDHLIDLAATTTAIWTSGEYAYQAYCTKAAERYQVDQGLVSVLPNLAAQSTGYDALPYCFTVRDAIVAVLEQRATESQTSIAVGGRQISEMSHDELQTALARAELGCTIYKRRIRREQGKPTGAKVKTALRVL